MKTVHFKESEFENKTKTFQVNNVSEFLLNKYGKKLPTDVRVYHHGISVFSDVTPTGNTKEEIKRKLKHLKKLDGHFYITRVPGDPVTAAIVAVVAIVVAIGAAILLRPKLPNTQSGSDNQQSANNQLSERSNKPRINSRIADIFGELKASVPDLIGQTVTMYQDHVEKELSYMCIGVGSYEVQSVKDDSTLIEEIEGCSVEIFGPNTSPLNGSPELRIGVPITTPLGINKKIESVNDQTLLPADAGSIANRIAAFQGPDKIISRNVDVNYSESFVPGDKIVVSKAIQYSGKFIQSYDDVSVSANFTGLGKSNGILGFAGDLTEDWQPGQLIDISKNTIFWYDTNENIRTANINGFYIIATVNYIPSSIPGNPGATFIVFDTGEFERGWREIYQYPKPDGLQVNDVQLSRDSGEVDFNLDGEYTIVSVSSDTITLSNPAAINADWNILTNDFGTSKDLRPTLSTQGVRYVGWFSVKARKPINRIISNFVCRQGSFYMDNEGNQSRRDVHFELQAQRLDSNGNPVGSIQQFGGFVEGSGVTRSKRARTISVWLDGEVSANWRFRAIRLTNSGKDYDGQIVDELSWESLYTVSDLPTGTHFGNVTTLYAQTLATTAASNIQSRKINCHITRKLPRRISGDQFTTELYPTKSAADILAFLCLDMNNGKRKKSQVDFDSIYDTYNEVVSYFGTEKAAEFCYTFDQVNLSFEEMATAIAQAMFCQVYRQGSRIRLYFEKKVSIPSMLFNYRNVLPGTEEHSGSFGTSNSDGADCIEFEYVSEDDDTQKIKRLPESGEGVTPQRTKILGVKNDTQAHFHAWRLFMKMKYQRRAKTFDALQMANMLIPKNVVLCADHCRPETISGDVMGVDGLTLYLDTSENIVPGSIVFLQMADFSVDAIECHPVAPVGTVRLSRLPIRPIQVGDNHVVDTSYTIVAPSDTGTIRRYMVADKSPKDELSVGMQVVEYSDKFYDKDKDFINGLIN